MFASAALFGKHLVESLGIKTDHDLIADDNGGRRVAFVLANQFHERLLVFADVLDFEIDTFLRKVALSPGAWGSTRLAENDNFFLRHSLVLSGSQ
jgi:hypothetical protein